MGNEHLLPGVNPLNFFEDAASDELFAKLDFQLKDGMHFQDREHQQTLFHFLRKHEASLAAYYDKYFEVRLDFGGEGAERYYFLDFNQSDRGRIDGDHRYFLKPEYVIIGFLIYKIVYIDRNFELNSVKKLQQTIQTDYEELKNDIYRLLAKLRKTTPTALASGKVNDMIADALREFKKLGWVLLDEDYFDLLPSFSRLNKLYGDYINHIEDLIKSH